MTRAYFSRKPILRVTASSPLFLFFSVLLQPGWTVGGLWRESGHMFHVPQGSRASMYQGPEVKKKAPDNRPQPAAEEKTGS